jgi:hypothetical protein
MTTTINQSATQIQIADIYYIRVEFFYQSTTFNAPEDGALRDESGLRMEFATREAAAEYLTGTDGELESMGCLEHAAGKYSPAGTYYLAHGEYSPPVYTIRKVSIRAK